MRIGQLKILITNHDQSSGRVLHARLCRSAYIERALEIEEAKEKIQIKPRVPVGLVKSERA